MPGEWPLSTLADAPVDIIDGDRGTHYPKQSDFNSRGFCLFLNAGNVTKDGFNFLDCAFITEEKDAILRKGKLERHDVVLTTRGTVGNVAYFDANLPFDNLRINSGMVTLRAKPSALLPRFLYLFVCSNEFTNQVASLRTGSAQPQLPIRDINRIKIPVPPLPEQRAIAHILGTLDDKIELNRRMNETLDAMARALFQSWFVNFDPVRSKAEGRDPGLPKDIADLFPDCLVDSEMGEIPAGWEVGTLADFAELNPESWSKNTAPDKIRYVDLANTKWGKIEETQTYLWKDAPSRAQRILRPGDTIVGTVRPGNGSFTLVAEGGITGSTGFAVLRPHEAIYEEYIYLAATSSDNIEWLSHLADGAAYPAVRPDVVLATQTVLPKKSLIECFARATKPVMAKIAANERESRIMAALRDVLLPVLISGELRVKGAERFISRAQRATADAHTSVALPARGGHCG
jgi:type I restriction enzyme, S subunit